MDHNQFDAATASHQEIFDYVLAHLRTQGVMALTDNTSVKGCAYRGANRTMCAFGVLIHDDEYAQDFEGRTAETVAPRIPRLSALPAKTIILFSDLQGLHDSFMPMTTPVSADASAPFEREAEHIAAHFCLTYTPPA